MPAWVAHLGVPEMYHYIKWLEVSEVVLQWIQLGSICHCQRCPIISWFIPTDLSQSHCHLEEGMGEQLLKLERNKTQLLLCPLGDTSIYLIRIYDFTCSFLSLCF